MPAARAEPADHRRHLALLVAAILHGSCAPPESTPQTAANEPQAPLRFALGTETELLRGGGARPAGAAAPVVVRSVIVQPVAIRAVAILVHADPDGDGAFDAGEEVLWRHEEAVPAGAPGPHLFDLEIAAAALAERPSWQVTVTYAVGGSSTSRGRF